MCDVDNSNSASDHFYEIYIDHGGHGYFVYYRTPMDLSPYNVPKYAVRDKQLIAVDMRYVQYVLEITAEEYFEHMWD